MMFLLLLLYQTFPRPGVVSQEPNLVNQETRGSGACARPHFLLQWGGRDKGVPHVKRWTKLHYVLAFLAVCVGALVFLQRFTRSEPAFAYPAWETGAVASAAGAETAFDPSGPLPALEGGETYRFALTLPPDRENGTYLIFETAGLEAAVFLDGTEVWRSAAVQDPGTINQSQVHLPLPAGGGEALTMELRPL